MSEEEVALVVNGQRHEGWKNVTVRASIDELAQDFTVGFSEKWVESGRAVPIREGDAAELWFDDTLLVTGYVDDFNDDYDNESHDLTVVGRAKTADLIDCPAIYQGGQIRGKTAAEIIALLCEPYGIGVEVDPVVVADPLFRKVIPRYKLREGETVLDAVAWLARSSGVIQQTSPRGNLVIARAATTPLQSVEIRRGENVLRGSFHGSMRERFSDYIFKGQTAATDDWNGLSAAQIKHVVKDSTVQRYRPRLALAERQGYREDLGRRAVWERNTRASRSERLVYTVRGWKHILGFWQPNTIVRVLDPFLRWDDNMLIVGVTFTRNMEHGRTAEIELTGREAYDVLEPPPKRAKRLASNPLPQAR